MAEAKLVHELDHQTRSLAVAAFTAAHGSAPNLGFAPDRAWIEGYCSAAPTQAQEPVAWRTFDGEGNYDFRDYFMNEGYAADFRSRNPKHADWVEPLYTHPALTAQVLAVPAPGAPSDNNALRCAVGNCMFNGEVAQHAPTCTATAARQSFCYCPRRN